MKTSQFIIISLAILFALVLMLVLPPAPAQSRPMLGLTLTASAVAPSTSTPVPPLSTATTVPPLSTATPKPHQNNPDPKTQPVILPPAGVGEMNEARLSLVESLFLAPPAGPMAQLKADGMMNLSIPSIDVDVIVRPIKTDGYSWDIRFLGEDVGWLSESSLPLAQGNTVLVGHLTDRSGRPPFKNLQKLENGRLVILETDTAQYYYRVVEQKLVDPTDLSVLQPAGSPRLTLITCANWSQDLKTYVKRRVVVAELVKIYGKTISD